MKGSLSHELDVDAPAGEVWGVYGTLLLEELIPTLLPDAISKMEADGDGDVGTVLTATMKPSGTYKEKFVRVDNEKRVKEAKTIEGGLLDLGFSSFLYRFEILEKSEGKSTVRSTVEYEVDEEHAANVSFVTTDPVAAIAEGVAKYLLEKKAQNQLTN